MKKVYVASADIDSKFDGFVIDTTDDEVRSLLQAICSEDEAFIKGVFVETHETIMEKDPYELMEHLKNGSTEWENWATDVLIYFACRYALSGKKIPKIDSE